jgi:hypothetical protein
MSQAISNVDWPLPESVGPSMEVASRAMSTVRSGFGDVDNGAT